ncbi:MAG: hypothetical protein J6Y11_01905 [Paludibacteraceae bacterium]|nr:hypothetical protein [Paludibacteraceae bacterium]
MGQDKFKYNIMWTDNVKNSDELKAYYGQQGPDLSHSNLWPFEIDCHTNKVRLYLEFEDWPTPLPADWVIEPLAFVYLELELEGVHYNTVNLNCNYNQTIITIEPLSTGGINIVIKNETGSLVYNIDASTASVISFGYGNHKWD